MKAIINANILTMTGNEIKNGVVVYDEKIQYVGDDISKADGCESFDAEGAYLLPGLIDAHCHLGMVGDSVGVESDDANEDSEPIMPQLRAVDAINPFDKGFAEARASGVTCVLTGPGSANPIAGQFAAIKTAGICVDDMIVKAPAAIKMALGENPKTSYADRDQSPITRMGTMALIREALYKARDYAHSMSQWEQTGEDKPEFDIKSDALLPLMRGEIPAKIHAHRADDICSALRIAEEFGIKVTIEHCTDGEAIAEILAEKKVPVMLGPTLSDRSKPELASLGFSVYKTLAKHGVTIAIITDHPEITVDNLLLVAQLAIRSGLDSDTALRAITSQAAQNCGIADRVGSIEVGKDADFAMFDKHPTDFYTKNIMTIIDGKAVYKA